MKKTVKILTAVILAVISVFPLQAFAAEENPAEWEDIVLSDAEFQEISAKGTAYTAKERATGLITSGSIAVDKSGTTLKVCGTVNCTSSVVKCGFKEVIVQRKTANSSTWSDYVTYEDQYWDTCAYTLSKAMTVPSGYQYRVSCTMYAKKNIFSVQTIDVVSNTIAI